tara:strand:+ start:3641 stop:4771 length:1131 start_codon:yes stop_codon:yes gene_type:complete
MKRIVFPFFFLISINTFSKYYEIKSSSDLFRYIGRFDLSDTQNVKFAHSGNQIEFLFKGKNFRVGLKDTLVKDGGENTNYYNITINGTVKYVVQGTSNLKYHEIEINSMDSFSRVEIFKKTEAICGTAIFYGIRFKEGKIKKTEAKKRRVEWVGDSFLVGYGNRVSIEIPPEGNPNTGFHSINQDGYFAFGAIVSRNLNADFSCVGVSGRGVYRNFDGSQNGTIPKVYRKLYPGHELEKEYDFSFNPDLIVIKIGTNDFGGEMNVPPDMTDSLSFSDAYMEFLQYVTQKNPNAKIVLAVGGGITDFYPIGLKRLSRFKSWVKIIKEIADKEFSNKFGFFEFQPQNPPYGEDWHPTLISQKKFAAEITPYLIEFMKW